MKVGGNLYQVKDDQFWRLAFFFVSELKYRLIKISDDHKELWLEKFEHKKVQIIRLLRYDIDWGNWLQRDIELTARNGEWLRRKFGKRNLKILNLYLTTYPPVDDYEYRINKPFVSQNAKKTMVETKLLDSSTFPGKIHELEALFNVSFPVFPQTSFEEETIEKLKHATLKMAVEEIKKEKDLFEYGKPFFTYIFIAIQVFMFFILEMNGGSTNTNTLIQYGAKFNPLILEGEWWRFITPMFLHIGFIHLLMNTLALYYLGATIEKIFGNVRFLFIYLIAGFSGSLASFLFSSSISAGASGAIFGCFGALLYFGFIYPSLFFRTMGMNIFMILAINLLFGFTVPGVDNAGHIGGLIGGFLATGIVHFPKKKKLFMQSGFLLGTIILISSLLFYSFAHPSAVLDEQSLLIMTQEYIEKEDYDKAYSLLTNEDFGIPTSAEYYFLLSYTEIKLNKFSEAKDHLLKAIELKPSFHEAHYNLALVYLEENNLDKAKKHFAKALEIDPDNKQYQKFYNRVKDM